LVFGRTACKEEVVTWLFPEQTPHPPAYADLSARIRAHALTEEQILYPAAILAGEFVRQNVPDSDKAAG
jgi:hypothetical protein